MENFALLGRTGRDHERRPILREENLSDASAQAGFRAGLHLRFFDDPGAMLHSNAYRRTLIFVRRMALAETAQASARIHRYRSRGSGKRECG